MSTQNNKNNEELNNEELKSTDGGGLLGGNDNSRLTGIVQGGVGISQTDDNGDTESTNINFGTGSLLDSQND